MLQTVDVVRDTCYTVAKTTWRCHHVFCCWCYSISHEIRFRDFILINNLWSGLGPVQSGLVNAQNMFIIHGMQVMLTVMDGQIGMSWWANVLVYPTGAGRQSAGLLWRSHWCQVEGYPQSMSETCPIQTHSLLSKISFWAVVCPKGHLKHNLYTCVYT